MLGYATSNPTFTLQRNTDSLATGVMENFEFFTGTAAETPQLNIFPVSVESVS